MTENTMPAPVAAEGEGGSNKKLLLVAGGAAAALVLGGAGYMLLGGGGSSDENYSLPVHKTKAAAPVTTKTLKSNVPSTSTLPVASTVRLGRDPFAALYVLPVVKAAAPATTGTTPVTPATGSGTGTTTTTTTGGGAGTGTGTPATPPTPVATTYPLKLVKVGGTAAERTATFTVNGKTQLAKVGSVFGKTAELKLLSLQQTNKGAWVAVVQVGDADPFDLNVNESILVM